MSIKNTIKKFTGSGNVRQGCQFDHSSGKFRCEKRRVHEGGQEEVIGVVSGQLDGGCNVVPDEQWESEEGVVNDLNHKFVDKIKGKCNRSERPSDY